MKCENCVHGITLSGPITLRKDNGTIINVLGKINTFCECKTIKSMDLSGDEMICSEYVRKPQLEEVLP